MKELRQWLRVRFAYLLDRIGFWPSPEKKFVIFGQGRTGSTLLVDLLNTCGDTHCDREIFNVVHFTGERISEPLRYVRGRSKRFFNKVYGFKVKVYQLREDHHVPSARDFLTDLVSDGFKVIYLSRENVLQHAYSNVKRSLTGITHINAKKKNGKISLPISDLLKEISLRLSFRSEEREVLNGIDYCHISYEKDLLNSEAHLATVNSIRRFLGLEQVHDVHTKYQKITDKSLADEITNYDEVVHVLQREKLDNLIW